MIRIVCSALVVAEDKVMLVQERSIDTYGLPGGKLEEGESLRDCLRRELLEEIGFETSSMRLVAVTEKPRTHEGNTVLRYIYLVELLEEVRKPDLSYAYYSSADIQSLANSRKIRGKDVEWLLDKYFNNRLKIIEEPKTFASL